MSNTLARLGLLILVLLISAVLLWLGRVFVARQRALALAAEPLADESIPNQRNSKVRILVFSSATCTQCHTLQQPVLRTLQQARGAEIDVLEIDAPASPELVKRYHILTVPSTVLLNTDGEAFAINYGFANAEKLQTQINALLMP
ncbi:MAG: thioredoxin family protein [Ktedonobacteraceae bacterium]